MPTIVKYILVFFISMVPIIELRGAVPIGVTYFGLNEYITLAVCVIGNMFPVPFIYLFGRKILEWGSKLKHGSGLFKWVLQKGEKAGKKLTANSKKSGAFIALMLFVYTAIKKDDKILGTQFGTARWLSEDEFSKLVPHYTFHKNEFDYPHTDFYVNGETYDDLSFLEKLEVMPDEQ